MPSTSYCLVSVVRAVKVETAAYDSRRLAEFNEEENPTGRRAGRMPAANPAHRWGTVPIDASRVATTVGREGAGSRKNDCRTIRQSVDGIETDLPGGRDTRCPVFRIKIMVTMDRLP
jgi:hypothetical protein